MLSLMIKEGGRGREEMIRIFASKPQLSQLCSSRRKKKILFFEHDKVLMTQSRSENTEKAITAPYNAAATSLQTW